MLYCLRKSNRKGLFFVFQLIPTRYFVGFFVGLLYVVGRSVYRARLPERSRGISFGGNSRAFFGGAAKRCVCNGKQRKVANRLHDIEY